jgi:hypothetical protein
MTKIVGTLGPKSCSVDTISACLKAGMFGKSDTFLDGPSLSRTETCFPISNCGGALSVAQFDFSWAVAEHWRNMAGAIL